MSLKSVPAPASKKELPVSFRLLLQRYPLLNTKINVFRSGLEDPKSETRTHPEVVVGHCAQFSERLATYRGSRSKLLSDVWSVLAEQKRSIRTPVEELSTIGLRTVLRPVFQVAWCAATADPTARERWSPMEPEMGQQVPTALLLQTLLGGKIRMGAIKDTPIRVVWNSVGDGIFEKQLDFSRDPPIFLLSQVRQDTIQTCDSRRIVEFFPWVDVSSERFYRRVERLLLPYALAAHSLINSPR
ncbi:MAG: hypothetical protein RL141_406 [Candidatus Parcubacteria bacterium]